ncbi:MAG: fibronectin type III domain-containing protein [Pseudohongiellaceae bacterium]|nr:fibronectin type III domain-containing protein [Pseudohongiellaceae bacterium]
MRKLVIIPTAIMFLLSAWAMTAIAIVKPQVSDEDMPEWVATIFVVNELALMQRKICQGSLIDSRWVATSAECWRDWMHLLPEDIWDNDLTHYAIRVGSSSTLHTVKSQVQSEDGLLLLFELDTPSSQEPVSIYEDSYKSLWNRSVSVLGTSETTSIAHWYFNPEGDNLVECEVDGEAFSSSDAHCYLVSKPQYSDQVLLANGIIVNPDASSTEKYFIDEGREFASDGSRVYINFRYSQSHTCFEDIGAPIVTGSGGNQTLVGLVSYPAPFLCSPALSTNYYARIAHYKDFIDATISDALFQSMCPEAPSIAMEETGGNGIRLYWDEVEGATGYKLIVSERLGYEPLIDLDFGNITELSTDIVPDVEYSVKLLAYNGQCTSPLSELLTVYLSQD